MQITAIALEMLPYICIYSVYYTNVWLVHVGHEDMYTRKCHVQWGGTKEFYKILYNNDKKIIALQIMSHKKKLTMVFNFHTIIKVIHNPFLKIISIDRKVQQLVKI